MGHSPNHTQELPHRQVSYHMPEGGDATTERKEPVTKPTIKDLEAWLEHQVGQLGTPTWWRELEAVLNIEDTCKFARKIWASFYVPEVRSRTNPGQLFSVPPAPRNLNRGAFYPKGLEYQDVRQKTRPSHCGLLPMFTALGREALPTNKPRGSSPGRKA